MNERLPMRRSLLLAGASCAFPSLVWALNGEVRQRVLFLSLEEMASDVTFEKTRKALLRLASSRRANVRLEHIFIPDKLPWPEQQGLIARAIDQGVEVVLAPTGNTAIMAANEIRRVGRSQPPALLFISFLDPVRSGIIPTTGQLGGRISGISLVDAWHGKRLEILQAAFANAKTIGVLKDRPGVTSETLERDIGNPAATLGLRLAHFHASTVEELDVVMRSSAAARMEAWYVVDSYISWLAGSQIIEHLRRLQRPAMHTTIDEVAKGGALMAYAADRSFVYDTLADLTLRVLAGEDPGSIPIQRPRRFVLAVRPRAEPAALRIHPSVVRRADRVF